MSMRVLLRRPDPLLLAIAVWLLVWPAAHAIVQRGRMVASAAELETLLPDCGRA